MSELSFLSFWTAALARNRATPPPGTMPSSTAARVACMASSTRSFFSLTSTSVEPPTRITATPPAFLLLALAPLRPADPDHRTPAGELGQALLQLLAVVVRGGLLDLRLDLRDAGFDVLLLARALDDRGGLLVDHHLAGAAEHVDGDAFELHAELIGDQLTAGQDRDVFQHGLAAIAEAPRLYGAR